MARDLFDMSFSPTIRLPKWSDGTIAIALFAWFSACLVLPVRADTASPWMQGFHTTVRIISGANAPETYRDRLLAGVHVKLEKGWKTYWRVPGDAGVPPHFDWSGSSNVGDLKVLWPAPTRLHDDYGTSIGYYDEVVFPVLIKPKNAGKPVNIELKFSYAVCKDICIPAEAAIQLQITKVQSSNPDTQALLTRYLEQVPAHIGKAKPGRIPSLRNVKLTLDGAKPELLIEAVFPKSAGSRDLFIEAPNEFYMPVPEMVAAEPGGVVRYRVDLSQGDDARSLRGKAIRFTLVSDAGHSEMEWQLN